MNGTERGRVGETERRKTRERRPKKNENKKILEKGRPAPSGAEYL